MFRIFTRPKGAPINDPRVGQPMWSKPGTPLDRVAKADRRAQLDAALIKYGVKKPKVHTHQRERERNWRRQSIQRGSIAHAVSGHVYDGAMTIGE